MSDALQATSVDLVIPAAPFATGWQTAISRPPRIATTSLPIAVSRPAAISLAVRKQKLPTRSFTFAQPLVGRDEAPPAKKNRPPARRAAGTSPSSGSTRIQPPKDVIKLQDRLYYLLQPSLESMVTSAALRFPFQPFPYQLQGIAFLYPRHAAILADEMGLGKTMQAITAIRLLLHSGELQRVLLVCPKPLVNNWQRELAQWAPEVPLAVIEGDRTRRWWQWREPIAPVKIANYELLARDQAVFADGCPNFDLVVLDEAQRIKNRSSLTSQVARTIPRTRSWALTGTPVENSCDDLVGIFEFLAPGLLSPSMTPRKMARSVSDYVLRRTKAMVLRDLPPKLFRDAELTLTAEQYASYKMAEEEGVLRLSQMGEGVTIQHVFELILRLKQICNFDPATGASSKLERLLADLEEVAASGQKAIVFSQWVETLTRLGQHLAAFGPLEYHGRIPQRQREDVLRRFREDPSSHVLLMSYGAGGVGLNLQFCSYVFLFDRWWNPAVEDQAINRAHRIGAAGPVTVTRMLTLETIEQRIDDVLEQKRQLLETVLSHTGRPRSLGLSQEEIFGLFNLPAAANR